MLLLAIFGGVIIAIIGTGMGDKSNTEVPDDSQAKGEPTLPPPPADYALEFDGKSRVELPDTVWDGKLPVTIEVRTRAGAARPYPRIVCKLINGGALQIGATSQDGWQVNVSNGPGTGQLPTTGAPFPATACDVALVVGNERIRVFENGRLGKEIALKHKEFTAGMPPRCSFGAEFSTTNQQWTNGYNGTIDEIRISRAVRYEADYTPPHRLAADMYTMALYHFDEGQGSELRDSSGSNRHGKIVGAKWVKASVSTSEPR